MYRVLALGKNYLIAAISNEHVLGDGVVGMAVGNMAKACAKNLLSRYFSGRLRYRQ